MSSILRDRDDEPTVSAEVPEFLAGPLDGEEVPVARRDDQTIYCARDYPWVIVDTKWGGVYAYERTPEGDFVCVGPQ
jgi:hypothetical protein